MDLNAHLLHSLGLSFSANSERILQELAEIERTLGVDSLAGSTEVWVAAALERAVEVERELSAERELLGNLQSSVAALFRAKKALAREDEVSSQDYTELRDRQRTLLEQLRSLTSEPVEDSHEDLLARAGELEVLEQELQELEGRAGLLKDLPAQTDKAKARLEAAQQELQTLEEEWTSRVTNMWTS